MPTPYTPNTMTLAEIENAVNTNLPGLVHLQPYTLEQLVGSTLWNTIPKPTRLILGHEFRAKAGRGELPVVHTGRTGCNKAVYHLM